MNSAIVLSNLLRNGLLPQAQIAWMCLRYARTQCMDCVRQCKQRVCGYNTKHIDWWVYSVCTNSTQWWLDSMVHERSLCVSTNKSGMVLSSHFKYTHAQHFIGAKHWPPPITNTLSLKQNIYHACMRVTTVDSRRQQQQINAIYNRIKIHAKIHSFNVIQKFDNFRSKIITDRYQ